MIRPTGDGPATVPHRAGPSLVGRAIYRKRTACSFCLGKGHVTRYRDGEPGTLRTRVTVECSHCKGSGRDYVL